MPTFDGKVFTYTRENAAERDKELPDLRGLSLSGIDSSGALEGLGGVDTAFIRGDRKDYIKGNDFVEREKTLTDITHQDVKVLCEQNHDQQILQNSTFQIGQDRWQTIKGDTIEHYTGEVAQVFQSKKEAEEPLEWFHNVNEIVSYGTAHSDNFSVYSLAAVTAMSAFVGNLDLRGGNFLVIGAEGEWKPFHHEEKEEDLSIIAMRQSIRVTEVFAMAVEPGVGAAMLHEVALTQEIIAVGGNQFM
jgi:hypothetical protein